jgi:hypothetical protein
MLLGIREGSDGMGNNAEEIKTATLLFDNIVIKCYQDQVIDCIDRILAVNNIALNLYFKTLKPLSFTDSDQLEGKDSDVVEEETGIELTCLHEETEMDKEVADELINLGEDFPDKDWDLVEDAEVNYDTEDSLDNLITELNTPDPSFLSKVWKFVSTGRAYPKARSAQDKKVGENYFKVRYYYSPQRTGDNAREFCTKMTKAKKIYRKEDIIRMTDRPVNPGWGPRGNNQTYSIWLFKGGGTCHHSWRRLTFKSKTADINVRSTQDLIGTRRAEIDGYKVTNPYQVSIQPRNLPNKGFMPGNPQGF